LCPLYNDGGNGVNAIAAGPERAITATTAR